ncbi:MAG: magnesium transporter, partial [Planctomycetia bacterium]|nr:magnesium transporter [Planctomycetia bacterium]
MINTLYLPELREMLAQNDAKEMAEFCQALHPARTAEFMEGLTAEESWEVLRHAEPESRAEIFSYLERDKQVECVEKISPEEAAELFGRLANDDSVDLLAHVRTAAADAVLARLGAEQRRAILRLRTYPEHTAGAMMTTEFARVGEGSKVRESLEEVGRQAERLETIYYLYVVDDEDHLRGIVSARQLLSAMGKPDVRVRDVMERDVISVGVEETEEAAAQKVADFDLLAIPVVDHEHRILGIITHDDAIDEVRRSAILRR